MNDTKQHLLDQINAQVNEIEEGSDPFDVLEFALDIEYTINGNGEYLGAKIVTATGGPHIEINTRYDKVIGIWGRDRMERPYEDNLGLHEYMEEVMPQ